MIRLATVLLAALVCVVPAQAQQGPNDQTNSPQVLPRMTFPKATDIHATTNILACGWGTRQMSVSNLSFEVGDSFNGQLASAQICGGCWYANAPGAAPPGYTQPDYAHPITLTVNWGDGKTTAATITSDHLLPNPTLGLASAGGIVGQHTYSTVVDPPQPYRVTMKAQCANDVGQWWDEVDNDCAAAVQSCVPSHATVGVYALIAPSNVTVARPVTHGQVTIGAVSVVLQKGAPLSGTKVTLTSSNP